MIDLATIKRKKVSGKATQGQKKKNILHNKLFWIISGVGLVVVLAAAITIPLVLANQDTTEEKIDYVGKTYTYNEKEVTFKKMNYEGVLMHANSDDYGDGTYYKHIFFAAFVLNLRGKRAVTHYINMPLRHFGKGFDKKLYTF